MNKANPQQSSVCFLSSAFGPVAIVWCVHCGRPKILRVLLSKPEASARDMIPIMFPMAALSSCSEMERVARQMEAFLAGDDISFPLGIIRLEICSGFQQRVLCAEHGVRRGSITTYKRIAGYLGNPGGARAVGSALARNPFPIIIPCHRAVRTDGSLGGYQGGVAMKRTLLEMEGVEFDKSGRVAGREFFY
jgi:methylated-DNA-[protein]-cysteine S-methyltransferase